METLKKNLKKLKCERTYTYRAASLSTIYGATALVWFYREYTLTKRLPQREVRRCVLYLQCVTNWISEASGRLTEKKTKNKQSAFAHRWSSEPYSAHS